MSFCLEVGIQERLQEVILVTHWVTDRHLYIIWYIIYRHIQKTKMPPLTTGLLILVFFGLKWYEVSICRSILTKLMEIHRQFVKKRFRVFFSYNPSSWLMNNTVLTENFYFHFMYCTYDYRCCCIPPPGGVLRNCVAKTAGKIHQGPYWSVLCYCRTRPIRISDGKVDKVNEF